MNKAYLIAPAVLLAAFIGIFIVHRSGYEERKAQAAAAALAAHEAKLRAEAEARKAAMADAIAQAEQRRAEREARLAREAREREIRQAALDARDRAYRDRERLTRQAERLRRELDEVRAEIATLATARALAESEKVFLEQFVAKARENAQELQMLMSRLNTPASASTVASR
jgi:chromosome segregation ATPase